MEQFLTHFGYWGIFLVLMASGLGLPFPEDIPLLFGGYLCAQGYASLEIMIPFTFLTVVGADSMLYLLGRRYGRHVPNLPLFRRFLTPERLANAEMAFHKHGGKTLFTSRFLPGIRAGVFFTAGVFKIPVWKFLLFDGAAALLSVPLLVLLGYWFSSHLDKVKDAAFATQMSVGALVACIVAGVWWYKRRKRLAAKAQEEAAMTADSSESQPLRQDKSSMGQKVKTPIIKALTPPPRPSKGQA